MTQSADHQRTNVSLDDGVADPRWGGLNRLAGLAGAIIAVLLVGEVLVYAFVPRPETALEHFELFQENRLVGLLTLDLLGMVAYLAFIPLILALYLALRRVAEAVMAISHREGTPAAASSRHRPCRSRGDGCSSRRC